MSGSRLRPYLGPVVALLVVLALGAGTVYAAIPNGDGKYYACLTKSTGALKVINYPKVKCATGQQLLKWSQQGPAGAQGAQGVQGPQGPAGASGSSNWGDIANKPADLADGQVGWGEVANKPDALADGVVGWGEVANVPPDFTDGVDNEGVTGIKLTRVVGTETPVPAGAERCITVVCPAGARVTGGGGYGSNMYVYLTVSQPFSTVQWTVCARNTSTVELSLTPQAVCMSVEPTGAFTTAKKGLLPASVKKDMKKRGR